MERPDGVFVGNYGNLPKCAGSALAVKMNL